MVNYAAGSQDVSAVPERKLRLCYISNPNSIHTYRWVTWFKKRGHAVCLLADVPLKETLPDVPIIDLSEKYYARIIRFPVWAVWIKGFLREWQPDILHAHRVNSAGWLAAASGFHPFVLTPWGSDVFIQPQKSRVARMLAKYALGQADLVTIISKAMGEQLIQLQTQSNKIRVIRTGVELDIFNPYAITKEQIAKFHKRICLPSDAFVVLSPRAVHRLYNLDIILQAIPLVLKSFPKVYFVFLDYNSDPVYKRELDEICLKYGLFENVRWLSPTRDRGEMAKIYLMSDIVISIPSSDGGTPGSVLEAMACGKPVICSDLLASSEFINNKNNGLVVPVREVIPLAEAIVQLIKHPDERKKFGHRSYQIVNQKANFNVEMEKMEKYYLQLSGFQGK